MILIDWNCQGNFRTKYEELLKFNWNVLVIQECENHECVKSKSVNY